MSADEQAQFLQKLAEDLNTRNIVLPSFPDVVIKIRTALEDPTCSSGRLAEVAKLDPVLVSRLLMAANSAFHNRAGIEIVDLNLAISRLGFEVVRNTAITLAIEQIFNASQHEALRERLQVLWARSMSLSSMCYVIARSAAPLNADHAFLAGLLHDVGKLYILTQAKEYPGFLGDEDSLNTVLRDWHPSVGCSIVGAWGFAGEVVQSIDIDENLDTASSRGAALVDVVYAAIALLDAPEETLTKIPLHPSMQRLGVTGDSFTEISEAAELHAQSMRHSI
ncbi:MAG: HDOD domain-containing protein [Gammaproteobacteria bacterium]|nr:HDOD domain-containing protein [Gammaproteobacteria bacterium]